MDTFLSNSAIVSEAESELKLCRARERQTVDKLLQVCLAELAERNYIEFSSDGKRIKMKYESRVLVDFIRDELRKAASADRSLKFDEIYRLVSKQFNFFNKDLVYNAVDQLHQNGDIITDSV